MEPTKTGIIINMIRSLILKKTIAAIIAVVVILAISPHGAQAAPKQPAPVISNNNSKKVIRKCNDGYKKCEANAKRKCKRQASRGSREPLQLCIDGYTDDCDRPYERCLKKGKVQ